MAGARRDGLQDPHSLSRDGGLEDVTQVKKYVMSEEDYEKRGGTLRAYKREMLKKNPDFKFFPAGGAGAASEAASAPALDVSPASVAHVTVGSRCEVDPGARRGVVCYVGEIPELGDGHWVRQPFRRLCRCADHAVLTARASAGWHQVR